MAASVTQAVGTSTSVNSTQNSNTTSTVKSDNGFCIVGSLFNTSSDSYIKNYQAISFDAVTATQVQHQAEVSSYAIEAGSASNGTATNTATSNTATNSATEVSDHVQIKNTKITMSGVISETPIKVRKDLLYSTELLGNRVSQAITYLTQIINNRQPITLLTEHRSYQNVILTSIDYSYQSEYAMVFNLEFEQVRLVTGATVNAIATKTASTTNSGKATKVNARSPTGANIEQQSADITGGNSNKSG